MSNRPGGTIYAGVTFEDWCGNKLSDHVPLVLDIDLRGDSG